MIPVGTLCYIVRVHPVHTEYNGMVVTVVGHREWRGTICNEVSSPSIPSDVIVLALDENLKRIDPGKDAKPTTTPTKKDEPVTA